MTSQSDRYVTLKRIFNIQKACYLKNRSILPGACDFISECLELILNREIKDNGFTDDESNKFKIIHQILNTALSSSINSYKLILNGCSTDAIALLRIVYEACIFLDYTIEFDAYEEIKNEVLLTKKRQKLTIERALSKLEKKEKTDRGKLFGDLSRLGSHLTSYRMGKNYFKINGENHVVTGYGLPDEKELRSTIGMQMRLILYMLNLIVDFYKKTKPSVFNEDFFIKAEELNTRYKAIK